MLEHLLGIRKLVASAKVLPCKAHELSLRSIFLGQTGIFLLIADDLGIAEMLLELLIGFHDLLKFLTHDASSSAIGPIGGRTAGKAVDGSAVDGTDHPRGTDGSTARI